MFPVPFDTTEDEACPECVGMAQLWVDDRPAFDARVREREERWREMADKRYEAERPEVDYEESLRRQDAALWEGKPPADKDEDDDLALRVEPTARGGSRVTDRRVRSCRSTAGSSSPSHVSRREQSSASANVLPSIGPGHP